MVCTHDACNTSADTFQMPLELLEHPSPAMLKVVVVAVADLAEMPTQAPRGVRMAAMLSTRVAILETPECLVSFYGRAR